MDNHNQSYYYYLIIAQIKILIFYSVLCEQARENVFNQLIIEYLEMYVLTTRLY
jgi:hypothetical protein